MVMLYVNTLRPKYIMDLFDVNKVLTQNQMASVCYCICLVIIYSKNGLCLILSPLLWFLDFLSKPGRGWLSVQWHVLGFDRKLS